MALCSQCGVENPEQFRFCGACGSVLPAGPVESRQMRKTVTVVFSDLVGSTALGERLDPESLREVIVRYYDCLSRVIARHGGTVAKFIGDAVMAVFGIPTLHEDDALRAVRAAAEFTPGLAGLNAELEEAFGVRLALRTGVNTGEVVVGDPVLGQEIAVGDAVNLAARLEQAARPGDVLVGESTWRLIRDIVTVEPVAPLLAKGKAKPVTAYRLAAIGAGTVGHARRLDGPMVGRDREYHLLNQILGRVVQDRACHLVTVTGMAGVGKSRLIHEFLVEARKQAAILRGRCLDYGEGISFWPIAEVVRQLAGIRESDTPEQVRARITDLLVGEKQAAVVVEGIAAILGLKDAMAPAEDLPWAMRKLFQLVGRHRPLVVVLDDLQWGEPILLDLLEDLLEWTHDTPLMLCCIARPELLERRPGWGIRSPNSSLMRLDALEEHLCGQLIDNLLGRVEGHTAVRGSIMSAAEGNPLFIEELLAMLIEDGMLERRDSVWVATADVAQLGIPPSISALLAARLDRLDPEELAITQRASVVGKVFYRGAVAYLSPEQARPQVNTHLLTLTRKELIRPDRSDLVADDAFRFRHLLMRDATYATLPKRGRVDLHERFADWVERVVGERLAEYEEIVGYQLEQAYRSQVELGLVDERARILGRRAAERLAAAGRRALMRGDTSAAANLLERASSTLSSQDPSRLEVLVPLSEALLQAGRFTHAEEVLAEVLQGSAALDNRLIEAHARVILLLLRFETDPEGTAEYVRTQAERLIRTFQELGDELGLAKSWRLLAHVDVMRSRWANVAKALEQAVVHARRARDPREESDSLAWLIMASLWGSEPVTEGLRRCEDILNAAHPDRKLEATALFTAAVLQAMQGRFAEARLLVSRGRLIANDLRENLFTTITLAQTVGYVEMLGDDPAAAEREERAAFELLQGLSEKTYMASTAGMLGQATYMQERYEEAEQLSRIGREAAASDDHDAQVRWRIVTARVLAGRGEAQEGERLAREAILIVRQTDSIDLNADALLALAEILHSKNRPQDALPVVKEALQLYVQKGNLVSANKARGIATKLSVILSTGDIP
jgi:class 3 adenylate cyclase/tetratricopeptide (TPR) repeat protein